MVAGVDQGLDAATEYAQHVAEFERALDASRRSELTDGKFRVVKSIQRAESLLAT